MAELGEKVDFIKDTFAENKVQIRPDEGLGLALEEACALAAGEKLPGNPSGDRLRASAHDAHVVWALAEGLKVCVEAGLDVKAHLTQLTTGTTDYGTSGDGHARIRSISVLHALSYPPEASVQDRKRGFSPAGAWSALLPSS